jgi:hypothetical protein
VRGSEQLSGSYASVRRNTSVWKEKIDQLFCETGKLATGIFISFIVVYVDEVLQNSLFSSSTNN